MRDGTESVIDDPRRWYVVQTPPSREYVARQLIKQRGFDVFLPECVESSRRKMPGGRYLTTIIEGPLFPMYLFVRFDPRVTAWRTIEHALVGTRVLTQDDQPRPIRSDLVDFIRGQVDEARGKVQVDIDRTGQPTFEKGQAVKLLAGPFAGFAGVFVGDAGERVRVLLDILGRKVETRIDDALVAPV